MRMSRRQKRMSRNSRKPKSTGMMLTSLMDIFTVLVLYLIVNQGSGVDLDPPQKVTLPDSVVETVPKRSIVISVGQADVMVQGEPVVSLQEVQESKQEYIDQIRTAMLRMKKKAADEGDKAISESSEVIILADRSVPFRMLKKLMASSSSAGFDKISLAVNQKENQF